MTKQNIIISIVYWVIGIAFAIAIGMQRDSSSDQTVFWLGFLWAGVYTAAIIIYQIRKKRGSQ